MTKLILPSAFGNVEITKCSCDAVPVYYSAVIGDCDAQSSTMQDAFEIALYNFTRQSIGTSVLNIDWSKYDEEILSNTKG